MTFEQIKTITEKYGPVLEQLDRLEGGYKHGSDEYFGAVSKLKLAVADQFVNEVRINEQMGHQTDSLQPVEVKNDEMLHEGK